MPPPAALQRYFDAQPPDTRRQLEALRGCVLEVVPEAEEQLNYGIPAYALVPGGKREQQIMIAGYDRHVGLYPHPSVITHFADELSGFRRGKGSVQFPLDRPLPVDLVRRMVRHRWAQLNE